MSNRKKWSLILIAVTVLGLSYVAYSLFSHSKSEYFTVSEAKSQLASSGGQKTRIEGQVAQGTIQWDGESETLRFLLADEGETIEMVFRGVAPDEFKPGSRLIVDGMYGDDGIFEVTGFGNRRSICNICH